MNTLDLPKPKVDPEYVELLARSRAWRELGCYLKRLREAGADMSLLYTAEQPSSEALQLARGGEL